MSYATMRSSWLLGLVLMAACGGRQRSNPPAPGLSPTPTSTGLQVVFVTYVGNQNHWTDPAHGARTHRSRQCLLEQRAWGMGRRFPSGTTHPTRVDSTQSMAGGCRLGQSITCDNSLRGSRHPTRSHHRVASWYALYSQTSGPI